MPSATIADLPNELLLVVASQLPFSALVRLRNVSRKWRDIIAAIKIDQKTKRMFDAYICLATFPLLERTPRSVPRVTHADRERYIEAFNTSVNKQHGRNIDQGCMAGSMFFTWIMEWPSHAAVNGFSPASVITAFFDKASYDIFNGKLAFHPSRRFLLSMSSDPKQTILMRMPLFSDSARKTLVCSPSATHFNTWARFLPILTTSCSGDRTAVPLVMFAVGGALAELDRMGVVATINSEGHYRTLALDWVEYLLWASQQAALKLAQQAITHVDSSFVWYDDHSDLRRKDPHKDTAAESSNSGDPQADVTATPAPATGPSAVPPVEMRPEVPVPVAARNEPEQTTTVTNDLSSAEGDAVSHVPLRMPPAPVAQHPTLPRVQRVCNRGALMALRGAVEDLEERFEDAVEDLEEARTYDAEELEEEFQDAVEKFDEDQVEAYDEFYDALDEPVATACNNHRVERSNRLIISWRDPLSVFSFFHA